MPQAFAKFNLVAARMPFAVRQARFPLAVLLLCGMSMAASAEVVAQKRVSYFDISGNTADELDAALNARGPTAIGASSSHPGATNIQFGGQATYVEEDGRCHIIGIKVTVETEIILPRWKDRSHAPKRLSLVWDTLSADIRRHEERHAEIAREHARMTERAILKLPPERNCDLLQVKINAESARNIEEHDRDQARFDMIEAANFRNRIKRLMNYRSVSKNDEN